MSITDKIKQLPDGVIQTPVIYESRAKCIYQKTGYGIVAEVDQFTANEDGESIGQTEYDELCDQVGEHIATCINEHARLVSELETAKRALERLVELIDVHQVYDKGGRDIAQAALKSE